MALSPDVCYLKASLPLVSRKGANAPRPPPPPSFPRRTRSLGESADDANAHTDIKKQKAPINNSTVYAHYVYIRFKKFGVKGDVGVVPSSSHSPSPSLSFSEMLLASLWYGDVQQTGFPSNEDFMTYTLHRHTPFLARRPGMVHIAISEAIIISEIDKPGENTPSSKPSFFTCTVYFRY